MAVESGERWNGWLGLTHCLIYPQCPCEHSGEIHYLTSSITSHGQGKRPAFHTDTHPRDRLRGLTQWGRGSRRNVVTHREQKMSPLGDGFALGEPVQGVAQCIQRRTHSAHCSISRSHAYASNKPWKLMHLLYLPQGTQCLYSYSVGGWWRDKAYIL